LSIIPISFFGLNQFSIRFVSALAGILSIIALYFAAKKLFDKKTAIFSMLLFAIMPWSVGLSRIAIESNLAILFILLAIYFGFNNSKNVARNLSISVIFLGLSAYTYSAYSLFVPLVLLLSIIDNFYKTKIKLKKIIPAVIIFILIIFPVFINKNSAQVRFSQVGLTTNINSIGLINTLNDERGQCIKTFTPSICKILENKQILFTETFIKNYLSHFSPNFFYINGTVTQFSILPQRGLDYWFCSLFLILGFYFLFRKGNKKVSFAFISLFLLSAFPDSLTGDGNYSRASIMQPFIAILSGLGLVFLIGKIVSLRNKKVATFISFLIALLFIFGLSSFYVNYLTYFKNNYSIFSQYGYEDLMTKVAKEKQNYQRIYISKHLNDTKQYVYYLFYNKYDPVKYQSKKDVAISYEASGWISIDRIENIYFVQNPPVITEESDLAKEKILIISTPVDFPKEIEPVFVIKDKLGNVLFKAINLSDLLEYNREHQVNTNKNV
ncbi:MAG: hypothetical protein A2W22_06275, partial [Candidatus Levybacteria bacterium RBG_16_35_11]